MRMPAVAGQFYPDDVSDLNEIIEECFLDELGPSKAPPTKIGRSKGAIKGLVVPHAGYPYSGPCAATAYLELASSGFPDAFIILGPNHHGVGSDVAVMSDDWDMPFGRAAVDKELASKLTTGVIKDDSRSHAFEHSVEVQIPFLQKLKKDFKFVPVVMLRQDFKTAQAVGEIMAQAVKGKNVVVVAASDFSHVGSNFSMPIPKGKNAGQYAKSLDELALRKILDFDPKGLVDVVEDNGITMCGYGPVAAMMICAKAMGATKARLLKYYSSYDVMPSSSAVGYGAVVIE